MTREMGIEEARGKLGDLVTAVQQHGNEITITRNGRPAAKLQEVNKRIIPIDSRTAQIPGTWGHHAPEATARYRELDRWAEMLVDARNAANREYQDHNEDPDHISGEGMSRAATALARAEALRELLAVAYDQMWQQVAEIREAAMEAGDPIDA